MTEPAIQIIRPPAGSDRPVVIADPSRLDARVTTLADFGRVSIPQAQWRLLLERARAGQLDLEDEGTVTHSVTVSGLGHEDMVTLAGMLRKNLREGESVVWGCPAAGMCEGASGE